MKLRLGTEKKTDEHRSQDVKKKKGRRRGNGLNGIGGVGRTDWANKTDRWKEVEIRDALKLVT